MSVYKLVSRFKRKYSLTIAFNLMKHSKVVDSIIDKDEKVLYAFCGQKNDSHKILFDSCVVALTNKRIIVGQKRLLWGYQVITVTPELFNDLKLNAGLLFGRIEIDTIKENIFISDLDKKALDEIETNINNIMLKMKRDLKTKNDKME